MKAAFCPSHFNSTQQFLVCIFYGGEGENDSRMGNVGNAKKQKDEAWKQVEEKIYLDYLKLNMRNKRRTTAYS